MFGAPIEGLMTPVKIPVTSFRLSVSPRTSRLPVQDPSGNYVRPKVQDNGDGTYTVSYTPDDVGRYSIGVKFGGQNVPGAPFSVMTQPTGDASKVKIAGTCMLTYSYGGHRTAVQDCVTRPAQCGERWLHQHSSRSLVSYTTGDREASATARVGSRCA